MKNKINIGIIGCANIAKKYAIKSFQSLDQINKIFIASRDLNKSKAYAQEFGIEFKNSYEDLINQKEIDAVYIPLPVGLHQEWILKAAQAGKHVICEKSLTEDFESAKRIINYCQENRIILYENFMCGFHPQHKKVKYLIDEEKIGIPFVFKSYFGFYLSDKDNFRYNKELGGGSLNDAGAYTIFMARKIMGEPLSLTSNLIFDSEKEVDVQGTAFLEFPQNKRGFIAFGFKNVYQNNYSVWGTKGLIKVNRAYSISSEMKPSVELLTNDFSTETITAVDIPAANHFELIFAEFCNLILNYDQEKAEIIYQQLLAQAKAMEAMRISATENRKVNLNEIN